MQLHPSESLINSRYQLHQILGQGGMGAVYLCTDRLTDTKLALKRVLTQSHEINATIPISPNANAMMTAQFEEEHSEGAIRLALSQEFKTLASLRHPNIISVLDYGFDHQKQPFFTMSLLQNARTITEAAENLSVEQKVELIGEMLQALSYLHHRGIVHRDLKPDNVLVTSDMRVKVLDFGLAILRERQDVEEQVAGTIPYMAPEVLRGEPANLSADIFAAGLIAFELLAGHYPFPDKNVSQIIMAILIESPDFDELDISQELRDVLEEMLERDPEYRLADAHETLRRLMKARESKLLTESEEVRESFLQAARFVGRQKELKELNAWLIDATKGHGSSWLIGGESGVGKSRLVDELRIHALVSGVTVLRGQAVSGGGLAFQVWREPIRRLLLMSEIDDQECSILKTLIPDIERLLQRPIPDVETRGSTTYLDQLKSVIVKLFRDQNQPTMLILEDLQWADESLEILDILNTVVGRLRLLIVATYRDDERASLPKKVPGMNLIKIDRFSEENIEELSLSLLGGQQSSRLVELLKHETEGNVQFIIEVIRALAQEAGDLRGVTAMDLSEEVAAGGIGRILQRRLDNLKASDILLLQACAIVGREIDQALLSHFIARQEQENDIEDWLAKCLNQSIFELQHETWRFSHDRLRSQVVQDLSEDELSQLHQQVATAIEQVYPDAPEYYARLRYHWGQAKNRNAELSYAVAAGDYAMKLNMFADAHEQYQGAYNLLNTVDAATTMSFSAEILLKLGEAQFHTSHFEESQKNLQSAIVLMDEIQRPLDVAQAYYYLANDLWRQADYDAAYEACESSLKLAVEHQDERLQASILLRLGTFASDKGNYADALDYYQKGLIHALNAGDAETRAGIYNNLANLNYKQGHYEKALEDYEKSIQISRERGAQHRVVSTLQNLGAVVGMRGDYDKSLQYFQDSLELARNIGDRRRVSQILGNLGYLSILMKDFEAAREYLLDSLELARAIGNRREIAAAYKNLGEVEYDMGNVAQAERYFVDSLRESFEINAVPFVINALLELARLDDAMNTRLTWLGIVLAHPATQKEVIDKAEALVEELRQSADENLIEAQLKIGETMDLEKTVEAILNQYSANER
jgi:serine/threonine protein kinase/tetratricopeptide (TPR) repeat protein